jgi:hypothetical protein
MNKPRKIAKYPELWYNDASDRMMVVYPDETWETKSYWDGWYSYSSSGFEPISKFVRFYQDRYFTFLGELK